MATIQSRFEIDAVRVSFARMLYLTNDKPEWTDLAAAYDAGQFKSNICDLTFKDGGFSFCQQAENYNPHIWNSGMKNVAVGERIRWKLSFASEDIEDVYLEEELIETDSRRAFHEDPAKLRGLKSKKINPAFIKIEFTCRVAPSSLDDSQRPKSSVGDQMETSEDISANSAARSANLPIAKFDFASLGVRRIRLEFRRAEKVKGLKMWNWPAVLYFLGGGKNKWQPDYGREMQEEVLTRDLTHLKELSLYEQILQPFESGFKLLTRPHNTSSNSYDISMRADPFPVPSHTRTLPKRVADQVADSVPKRLKQDVSTNESQGFNVPEASTRRQKLVDKIAKLKTDEETATGEIEKWSTIRDNVRADITEVEKELDSITL